MTQDQTQTPPAVAEKAPRPKWTSYEPKPGDRVLVNDGINQDVVGLINRVYDGGLCDISVLTAPGVIQPLYKSPMRDDDFWGPNTWMPRERP